MSDQISSDDGHGEGNDRGDGNGDGDDGGLASWEMSVTIILALDRSSIGVCCSQDWVVIG